MATAGDLRDTVRDWISTLRQLLNLADMPETGEPDAEHRSTKKAVKALIENLQASLQAAEEAGEELNPEEHREVIFNVVDKLLRDKVEESQGKYTGVFSARGPEKTQLSALELFKAELDGRGIDEIPDEWKNEVQKCLRLLRSELFENAMPEHIYDQEDKMEKLTDVTAQGAELAAQFDSLIDFDHSLARQDFYPTVYATVERMLTNATAPESGAEVNQRETINALRDGLEQHFGEEDDPYKLLTKKKLESILDKMEQEAILAEKVADIDAFNDYPQNELWRLFLDGYRQEDGPLSSWNFDRREMGYMAGCMNGFNIMLESIDQPLTRELLVDLHDVAVDGVYVDQGDHLDEPMGQGIRSGTVSFGATFDNEPDGRSNFSVAGRAELEDRIQASIRRQIEEDNEGKLEAERVDRIFYPASIQLMDGSRSTVDPHGNLRAGTNAELLKAIEPQNTKPNGSRKTDREKQQEVEARVTLITDQLATDLGNIPGAQRVGEDSEERAKIRVIVRCCQDLEQNHVFRDGNCRTLGFIILNKLLLQNGLNPCIMKNPNRFDGFSEEELIQEVIDGQERFDGHK